MTDSTQFYQKNGLVIIMLSGFAESFPGDRITPIAEYEKRFGFRAGRSQTAIRFLLDNECARFEKRGPKGTYVYDLDYKKLWRYRGGTLLGWRLFPRAHTRRAADGAFRSVSTVRRFVQPELYASGSGGSKRWTESSAISSSRRSWPRG
jgi:hypothetical protein